MAASNHALLEETFDCQGDTQTLGLPVNLDDELMPRLWSRVEGVNINLPIPFPLFCKEVRFGRDPVNCDFAFRPDHNLIEFDVYRQISKFHFSILKRGTLTYLVDHSQRGTYINGVLVGMRIVQLETGDNISVISADGPCLQFFHIDAPVSAEQAFLNQLDIATQLLRESSVSDVDTTEAEQRRLSWGCLNGVNFNLPIFDLINDQITFGRNLACNFCFLRKDHLIDKDVHGHISKHQFSIFKYNHSVYLVDCSKRGTYVNGVRIGGAGPEFGARQIVLQSGDQISVVSPNGPCFQYFLSFEKCRTLGIPVPDELNAWFCVSSAKLGSSSSVYSAANKETLENCAMKVMQKSYPINKGINYLDQIKRDTEILKSVDHVTIVKVFDVFESKDHTFVAMEVLSGSSLASEKVGNQLDESSVRVIAYQLVLALEYLHFKDIIHTDVQPANILIACNIRPDNKVKLAGLSNLVSGSRLSNSGTNFFKAPELRCNDPQAYTAKVDIWSLGATLFMGLSGNVPNQEQNLMVEAPWDRISADAKGCIRKMLLANPEQRPSARELLDYSWFKGEEFKIIKKQFPLPMAPSLIHQTHEQQLSSVGVGKSERRHSLLARPAKPYQAKLPSRQLQEAPTGSRRLSLDAPHFSLNPSALSHFLSRNAIRNDPRQFEQPAGGSNEPSAATR